MSGLPVLHGSGLTLRFGGVTALDRVDVEVREEELLAIIGPNGAGKTSLFNVVSAFYRPQAGTVAFRGADITGLPTHAIARLGIARTFQGTHLFSGMTVLDNILVGRHFHMCTSVAQAFVHFPWTHREEIEHRAVVEDIIDFLEIEGIRHRIVGTLGYGLRKRVDLARALAMEPRVLLMDEPMAGMNTEEKEDLARFILDIREARRIPVVLVEHERLGRVFVDIPRLGPLKARVAGYLSGGEQQMLVIGRALMARPSIMLIDEPSLGLGPLIVEEIFGILRRLRDEGLTLLIVEQNARAALDLADHAYVMENGRIMLEGTAAQLRDNEDIREFYLGLNVAGERKSFRDVKHYRRRKRWLG